MNMHPKGIVAVLVIVLGGCGFAGWRYAGDGELHDAGPLASHQRYILNLGTIDLSTKDERVYELARLPDDDFTVGIRLSALQGVNQPLYEAKPLASVVRLEMTTEGDEIVISDGGPLSEWTWSGVRGEPHWSFVYRLGAHPGVWTGIRHGVLADAGWGTYFTARSKGKYRLKVTVVEPDSFGSRYQAQVLVKGGGWK
jgi:hypothetical protein